MPGGRPREFDVDEALNAAVGVFREHGFAGASLTELTAAMGVNRPSLYAAFGDKAALFETSVGRYAEAVAPLLGGLDEEPDVRVAFEGLFCGLARFFTEPGQPRGCLVATSLTAGVPPESGPAVALRSVEGALASAFEGRLRRARREEDLSADADIPALVRFFRGQLFSLSALARADVGRRELLAVARMLGRVLGPAA